MQACSPMNSFYTGKARPVSTRPSGLGPSLSQGGRCPPNSHRACRQVPRSGCWATAQVELHSGHTGDLTSKAPEIRQKGAQEDLFCWTKQWYPVAIVRDLEAYKPTPVKLLGKSLVLWRDGEEQWQCFADTCPHRLAPLSEGRIEADGTLQCAYHGWQFDSQGACTSVPQANSPQQEHRAAAHPRACATAYPTQVQHHLLWVWPDAGPKAHLEAMSKEAAVIPELLDEETAVYAVPWFMRELPYGHDVLIENVLDPAHLHWAHSGAAKEVSRHNAPQATMSSSKPLDDAPGFLTVYKSRRRDSSDKEGESTSKELATDIIYRAPGLINWRYPGPRGVQLGMYSTPTTQGNCRVFFCTLMNRKAASPKQLWFLDWRPSWALFLDHYNRNIIFDGDNTFLHMQDHKLQGEEAGRPFYMPTSMDNAVASFRRWMREAAGPVPWAVPVGPETWAQTSSRRELLDRYNQHTKHCKSCSKALEVFTVAQRAAVGCVGLAALSGAAAVGAGNTSPTTWVGIAAGAIIPAVVAWQLQLQRQKFIFMDYDHSEH